MEAKQVSKTAKSRSTITKLKKQLVEMETVLLSTKRENARMLEVLQRGAIHMCAYRATLWHDFHMLQVSSACPRCTNIDLHWIKVRPASSPDTKSGETSGMHYLESYDYNDLARCIHCNCPEHKDGKSKPKTTKVKQGEPIW